MAIFGAPSPLVTVQPIDYARGSPPLPQPASQRSKLATLCPLLGWLTRSLSSARTDQSFRYVIALSGTGIVAGRGIDCSAPGCRLDRELQSRRCPQKKPEFDDLSLVLHLSAWNNAAGRTDPQRNFFLTLEVAGDQAENTGQAGAERCHCGDGGDRDKRGDQPIFDCRNTATVLRQAADDPRTLALDQALQE